MLSIKQDMSGVGKKAQDRTWRNYYAVLVATRILFYKDKREAILVSDDHCLLIGKIGHRYIIYYV